MIKRRWKIRNYVGPNVDKSLLLKMARLRKLGWSSLRIGKLVGKTHATILYWESKNFSGILKNKISIQKLSQSIKKIPRPRLNRNKSVILYSDIIKNIEIKQKQKICPHNAMIGNRCWLCKYEKVAST